MTQLNADARFRKIQKHTQCIFAPIAKLWGAPEWRDELSLEENAAVWAADFDKFSQVAIAEKWDGFVVEMPKQYSETLTKLGASVNRVLRTLSRLDPAGEACMEKKIDAEEWDFRFAGIAYFIATFGSCYPKDHPRYAYEVAGTFLFVQPMDTFQRNLLSKGSSQAAMIRRSIRRAFRLAGRGYTDDLMENTTMAAKYVKQLDLAGPEYRWWLEKAKS